MSINIYQISDEDNFKMDDDESYSIITLRRYYIKEKTNHFFEFRLCDSQARFIHKNKDRKITVKYNEELYPCEICDYDYIPHREGFVKLVCERGYELKNEKPLVNLGEVRWWVRECDMCNNKEPVLEEDMGSIRNYMDGDTLVTKYHCKSCTEKLDELEVEA